MEEHMPFEKLLEQMGALLKQLKEGLEKGAIDESKAPFDVEMRLKKLKKDVDAFKKQGEKIVDLSNLFKHEMRKYSDGSAQEMTPEGQSLIEKARQLQQQAKSLEENYKTGSMPSWSSEKKEIDPNYAKNRRKKFKRLGSDDKWKPL